MAKATEWLSVKEFAAQAGIGRRSATAALAARKWSGTSLEVRACRGRGGRSGLIYEVSLRSLSEALGKPVTSTLAAAPTHAEYDHQAALDAALAWPARSQERAGAVKAIAAASGMHEDTVRRQLAKNAEHGAVGLLRKPPSNKGLPRVAISRAFSAAWTADGRSMDDAFTLHDRLEAEIASMWCGQHANAGAGRISRDASRKLRKWCEDSGFAPTGKGARQVFEVPRRMAERSSGNAVVNRMKTDASAHYNAAPFRRADPNLESPGRILMGDVHHMDIRSLREDGEGAYCIKLIAWLDPATRRVWVDPKTCAKGESVRKADVNASLASVFKHPDWGSPDFLYADNGKEYALRDGLTEPMRLAAEKVGRAPVIRSTAYNARAKGLIEGWFGRIERDAFSLLPGYGGGDRMRAKTANQGREIAPFDAPPATAEAVIKQIVANYNDTPQKALNGLSPNEAYEQRRQERTAVTWSIEALAYALADRAERVNRKGQVQLSNRFYELHDRALTLTDQRITVLHGPFIEGGVLVECDGKLTFAEEAPLFGMLDKDGANYSKQRRREFDREVSKRGQGLPATNPLMDAIQDHRPTVDLLSGPKATMAKALSPKARKQADDEEAARRTAENAEVSAILGRIGGPVQPSRKIA